MQINSLSADWVAIQTWAQEELASYTDILIAADNEEARGRIKQLQELLELPRQLRDRS